MKYILILMLLINTNSYSQTFTFEYILQVSDGKNILTYSRDSVLTINGDTSLLIKFIINELLSKSKIRRTTDNKKVADTTYFIKPVTSNSCNHYFVRTTLLGCWPPENKCNTCTCMTCGKSWPCN